ARAPVVDEVYAPNRSIQIQLLLGTNPAYEKLSETGRQSPAVPIVYRRPRMLRETFLSRLILLQRMIRIERQASGIALAHSRKQSAHSIPACYRRSSRSSR